MVAGKVIASEKLWDNIKKLEEWIIQIDYYFTIKQTCNGKEQMASVDVYTKGQVSE